MMHQYLAKWREYVQRAVNDGNSRWLDLRSYAFYRGIDANPEIATVPEDLTDDVNQWRYSVTEAVKQGKDFLPQNWTAEDIEKAKAESSQSWRDLTGDELWQGAFGGGQPHDTQPQAANNQDWQNLTGDELWANAFEVKQ